MPEALSDKLLKRLISNGVWQDLRRTHSPRALMIWEFYQHLFQVWSGDVYPEDLLSQFRKAVQVAVRTPGKKTKERPSVAASTGLYGALKVAQQHLRFIEGEYQEWHAEGGWDKGPPPAMKIKWANVTEPLTKALIQLAKSHGAWLQTSRMPGSAALVWLRLERMRAKVQKQEELRERDPEGFKAVQRHKRTVESIKAQMELTVTGDGLNVVNNPYHNKLVVVAQDPVSEEVFVYTPDGQRMTPDEYERDLKRDKRAAARRVMLKSESLLRKDLDGYDPKVVEDLPGKEELVMLTDDQVGPSALTRMVPVKWLVDKDKDVGIQVVTEGRWRGIPLDNMVSVQGRLLEGNLWRLHPSGKKGKDGRRIRVKYDPAEDWEPFVTVATQKLAGRKQRRLFIDCPGNPSAGPGRKALKRLAAVRDSVQFIQHPTNNKRASFYFGPDDWAAVKDALGACVLSRAAMTLLDDHFYRVREGQVAQEDEHLWRFDLPEIEGFKPEKRSRKTGEMEPFVMKRAQKKALAWLLTTGKGAGTVALDTGMGKTLVVLAAARKWVTEGDVPEGSNGRFLYVSNGNLRGNLVGQAYSYFQKHAAKDMADRIDALSYGQFAKAMQTRKYPDRQVPYWHDKRWEPEQYVAVFFDEAHELSSPLTSKVTAAVLAFKHPRKVCMTASPMDQEPDEAYTLYCITNNIDLNDPDPETRQRNRLARTRFRNRYCERVGSEVVGVKQDPLAQADLKEWVSRNIFYADKADPSNREDYELGELHKEPQQVQMDPAVEEDYRETAAKCAKALAGWVARYRDMGIKLDSRGYRRRDELAWQKELETKAGRELGPLLKRLDMLANDPGALHPGALNPKHQAASRLMTEAIAKEGKCLVWAEKAPQVLKAAQFLSRQATGKRVLAATTSKIHVFQDGQEFKGQYGVDYPWRAPFTKRRYVRDPFDEGSDKTKNSEWAVFILKNVANADPNVAALVCQGSYATGHNLQSFSTVIHLDRNSWSNETMKQRTARSYRTGQADEVTEHIIDVAYSDTRHEDERYDVTFDEVRKLSQDVQAQLFDDIIKAAQGHDLSAAWHDIPKRMASKFHISAETVKLMLGPYYTELADG